MTLNRNQRGVIDMPVVIALALVVLGGGLLLVRIISSDEDGALGSRNPSGQIEESSEDGSASSDDTQTIEDQSDEPAVNDASNSPVPVAQTQPNPGDGSGGGADGGASGGETTPQTKSFTIDAFNFGYSLQTMNVSPGDIVTVTLTNSGGNHDWVIDEIGGAQSDVIKGGESDTITFTVPSAAAGKTYNFYCSVGNHRAQGMEGSFVVSS